MNKSKYLNFKFSSKSYYRLHQIQREEEFKIVFAKDEFSPEVTLYKFENVADEIESRTEKMVGSTKNISDKDILLDIYSPDYPDQLSQSIISVNSSANSKTRDRFEICSS